MASSNKTLGQYLSAISELLGAESIYPPAEVVDKLNWYLDNIQTALTEGSGIGGFDVQVVDELPEAGEQGVLYLVSNSSSGTNIYDEYIWIESQTKYEMLGTTEVDISGKQDTLVSGENIKTINNSSVLGEGNLEVVSANPELAGSESNLTSLKVDDTKYKVSSVVANPELSGTEAELSGLEVNGTKYKAGGGKQLYVHAIFLNSNGSSGANIVKASMMIINDSATELSLNAIKAYIGSSFYPASGEISISNKSTYIVYAANVSNSDFRLAGLTPSSAGSSIAFTCTPSVTDTVFPL